MGKKVINIAFIAAFIISVAMDALTQIYPEYLNKAITTFLPIPITMIWYFYQAKKPNYIYMFSFVFIYFAATFYSFRLPEYFNISLILYSLGVTIYCWIINESLKTTIRDFFLFALLSLLVLSVPTYLVSKMIGVLRISVILFYVGTILLFLYLTILLNLQVYSRANKFALLSSCTYVISTVCTAILMFVSKNTYTEMLAIGTFWLTHFFMATYMLQKSKNTDIA